MTNITINVREDRLCAECGKPWATDNELCLECSRKAITGKRMRSDVGRAVQARAKKIMARTRRRP
jgi:predicted amidophosphoribosyltransferase